MKLRTCLIGATLALSLVVPAGAAGKPKKAVIVNKASKPANVKLVGIPTVKFDLSNGGLTLAGFPPVKIDPEANGVTLTGTPEVRVAGTPEVKVAGTPSVKLDPTGNEVQVVGSPTVKLDSAANDVDVQSSRDNPVVVRDAPEFWGVTKRVSPGAGAYLCEAIAVPAGRVARVDSVTASTTGSGEPVVVLRVVGRYSPGVATFVELPVPMQSVGTSPTGFTWLGQSAGGIIVSGDNWQTNNGLPADLAACVRAPAANSLSAAISVSGVYLR